MYSGRANLGVAPLILWGGGVAAAAGGAWVWNQATGIWDMLTLPGSTFGPPVPPPAPYPNPLPPVAGGYHPEVDAQLAEQQRLLWQKTVFDAAAGVAPVPPSGGAPTSEKTNWLLYGALGLAAVTLLLGRR